MPVWETRLYHVSAEHWSAQHEQGRCLMDGGGTYAGGLVCEHIRHPLGNTQNFENGTLWGPRGPESMSQSNDQGNFKL